MKIRLYNPSDQASWDRYVSWHGDSTPWHLSPWKTVFEGAYGHKAYYLIAEEAGEIKGLLPLFHIKSLLFGSSLTSMPFVDGGGILGDDEGVEAALADEAIRLGEKLRVRVLELRMAGRRAWAQPHGRRRSSDSNARPLRGVSWSVNSEKVRMLLPLPPDPRALMDSFKSKLRSQIRKPIKEGCESILGGMDLLDDFYRVFSVNMRDLGSPVHAKRLFALVLEQFPQTARICLVRKDRATLAGSFVIGFRDTLANPWASSLRHYSHLSPNMLLYWSVLKYGCEYGYSRFDFGRSTPGEGTCAFKEQWGARPSELNWAFADLSGKKGLHSARERKSMFSTMIEYWKYLPVAITLLLGPPVRRQISL